MIARRLRGVSAGFVGPLVIAGAIAGCASVLGLDEVAVDFGSNPLDGQPSDSAIESSSDGTIGSSDGSGESPKDGGMDATIDTSDGAIEADAVDGGPSDAEADADADAQPSVDADAQEPVDAGPCNTLFKLDFEDPSSWMTYAYAVNGAANPVRVADAGTNHSFGLRVVINGGGPPAKLAGVTFDTTGLADGAAGGCGLQCDFELRVEAPGDYVNVATFVKGADFFTLTMPDPSGLVLAPGAAPPSDWTDFGPLVSGYNHITLTVRRLQGGGVTAARGQTPLALNAPIPFPSVVRIGVEGDQAATVVVDDITCRGVPPP
jgi:hypothetical protein